VSLLLNLSEVAKFYGAQEVFTGVGWQITDRLHTARLVIIEAHRREEIRAFGVDGLWLMPVFDSPSYHGYDTVDFTQVQPEYGTNEDLIRLCDEAHRRGMRVILDFVMNHVSSEHPWFRAAQAPASAQRNWFVWRRDNPGWTQPWGGSNPTWHQDGNGYYYGVFWGGMPDLNYRTPAVLDQMQNYARLWLERGVDGFRLDATRHLVEDGPGQQQVDTPETHEVLKRFSRFVRGAKPEAVLVGENWTDTPIIATYFGSTETVAGGDELPLNFNFPVAGAILSAAGTGEADGLVARLGLVQDLYPEGVIDAPFLTNHDMVRAATQLGGDLAALRLCASILLTLPGAPFLYYGEEVGVRNGPGNLDESKRTPMPWDPSANGGFSTGDPWYPFSPGRDSLNVATQDAAERSLLAHYRRWIRARSNSPALRRGDLSFVTGADNPAACVYLRSEATEQVLVAHNLGASAITAGPFALQAGGLDPVTADPGCGLPASSAAGWTIHLPPRSSGAWRLR